MLFHLKSSSPHKTGIDMKSFSEILLKTTLELVAKKGAVSKYGKVALNTTKSCYIKLIFKAQITNASYI